MKRSTTVSALRLLALAAIVAALPAVIAHGDSESHGDGDAMDMDMSGGDGGAENEPSPDLDLSQISYFAYPEHTAAIYAHIVLMVLGWFVVLPICKKNQRNPCCRSSRGLPQEKQEQED